MTTLDPASRDALLVDWQAKKAILDQAVADELKARLAAVEACFGNKLEVGTNTFDLGQGYKFKVVHRLNYTFPDKDALAKALVEMSKLSNEGEFLSGRIVKYKPELSLTEYANLKAPYKPLVDAVLTIKPGTPSAEIVVPKAKA